MYRSSCCCVSDSFSASIAIIRARNHPGVYEIKSFGDEVDLAERNNFKDPAKLKAIRISFEQLYTKWSFYKGELPQYIEDDWAPYMAKQHAELSQEMAKHEFFSKLLEYAAKHPVATEDVMLCFKPGGLRAKRELKKGELTLVPAIPSVSKLCDDAKQGLDLNCEITLKDETFKFYIRSVQQPNKPFKEWKDEFLSPFFMVKSTAVEEEANMVYKDVEYQGATFQVLTNKRKVNAYGHLYTYEPKAEKKALQNAMVIEDEKEKKEKEEKEKKENDGESVPPAKKQRRATR